MQIKGYDAWRLQGPPEENEIGTEDGDQCSRVPEPDEDAPRRWKPRPCGGMMAMDRHGDVVCESCGAVALLMEDM